MKSIVTITRDMPPLPCPLSRMRLASAIGRLTYFTSAEDKAAALFILSFDIRGGNLPPLNISEERIAEVASPASGRSFTSEENVSIANWIIALDGLLRSVGMEPVDFPA